MGNKLIGSEHRAPANQRDVVVATAAAVVPPVAAYQMVQYRRTIKELLSEREKLKREIAEMRGFLTSIEETNHTVGDLLEGSDTAKILSIIQKLQSEKRELLEERNKLKEENIRLNDQIKTIIEQNKQILTSLSGLNSKIDRVVTNAGSN